MYFFGGKLTVGMRASTEIEFLTQKFPLNSFKIIRMGTLVIPSLEVYYGG
jgi:hypothetical protein